MDKYYLTKERFDELKAELEDLKTHKRREVAERLKYSKELGDLSENVEYLEAREEQSRVERRILELEEIIKNTQIIKKDSGREIVDIGSTIETVKDGQKFKFTIVGSGETRPELGLISNESPLGKAFLKKKAGEIIKIKTTAGEMTYKILKIC